MKYIDEFELNKSVAAIEFGHLSDLTLTRDIPSREAVAVFASIDGNTDESLPGHACVDYCNSWADGGPLIEKYGICLAKLKNGKWLACGNQQGITSRIWRQESDKPLVAAMLCVVDLVERAKRRGAYD